MVRCNEKLQLEVGGSLREEYVYFTQMLFKACNTFSCWMIIWKSTNKASSVGKFKSYLFIESRCVCVIRFLQTCSIRYDYLRLGPTFNVTIRKTRLGLEPGSIIRETRELTTRPTHVSVKVDTAAKHIWMYFQPSWNCHIMIHESNVKMCCEEMNMFLSKKEYIILLWQHIRPVLKVIATLCVPLSFYGRVHMYMLWISKVLMFSVIPRKLPGYAPKSLLPTLPVWRSSQ